MMTLLKLSLLLLFIPICGFLPIIFLSVSLTDYSWGLPSGGCGKGKIEQILLENLQDQVSLHRNRQQPSTAGKKSGDLNMGLQL